MVLGGAASDGTHGPLGDGEAGQNWQTIKHQTFDRQTWGQVESGARMEEMCLKWYELGWEARLESLVTSQ